MGQRHCIIIRYYNIYARNEQRNLQLWKFYMTDNEAANGGDTTDYTTIVVVIKQDACLH